MLANAKKIQKRNEKRKLEAKGGDSDDDGDDDDDVRGAAETLDDLIRETDSEDEEAEDKNEDKKKKKGRKNQFKTRLHEDGEDFVDFLSTTAAQSLTVKKDQRGKSKRISRQKLNWAVLMKESTRSSTKGYQNGQDVKPFWHPYVVLGTFGNPILHDRALSVKKADQLCLIAWVVNHNFCSAERKEKR